MAWRSVGSSGEPYPAALRALSAASGCYAIRDREGGGVLYVGSSVGRLRKTLVRHLQSWTRSKGWWTRAGFSRGVDPGRVYRREDVLVRWWVTLPDDARALEVRLIRRLKPRDNEAGAIDGPGLDLPPLPF